MELLKQKIRACGRALNEHVLLVDSFLNHQVDVKLMREVGREFAARFGIVLLMDHFRCTPYAVEALRAISAVDAAGRYYVQMGAAWALATFYLQLPQEVMRLLRTHPDDAVCRMAVRKLCESLRVPAGAKAQAKQIWKERKGV